MQPTRLHHPWDSPGKNTGVGCHFLLQCMKVKSESEVAQSCLTLSDPMDCSLPGSSIHGIFQARVLEWGAIAFSYSWVDHVNACITTNEEEEKEEGKKKMLFMFYFSSVITVIQLNHFKMTSKVLYKGNYKWVRKQLRLLQPIKSVGRWIPQRCLQALERKLTGGSPARPFLPTYLFFLSLSFRPFFPSHRICFTLATLPTLAALWIFLRSLSRMWYPGWKLVLRWPLFLPRPMEESKGDLPFSLL